MKQHSKITKAAFNVLITGLIILWVPLTLKAQLFETNELYSNTKVIKGKYYSGTGGGGYWSLDYVDSTGRIKVFYRIINGKKYKIAVYSYE